MKVAFVIVRYKEPEKYFLNLKKEIKKLKFADYKIYEINNSQENGGYASGVNTGIKSGLKAKADLFVILNPDVWFASLEKEDLTNPAKYFDIWGFAMRQDGKVYYGGMIDKWRMSGGLISDRPGDRFSHVDFVTGSFMIIKKEVIEKIGFFDEKYFLYYEDVDYCVRAKRHGFKVGIDSATVYEHFELSKINKKKNFLLARNRWRFFFKYSNLQQKLRELLRLPKTILEMLN